MKIKKSISIILSALMVISMLICPVYADGSAAMTLTGGNLQKGSTVSVPVVVSGTDKGITSFNFDVVYDTDNLELTDAVAKSPDFMGVPYQKGTDHVTAMSVTPYTGSEAICTLVFETKENVINGKYDVSLKLGRDDDSLIAYNDELITNVKVTPATITVTGGADKLTSANTTISGINASYEYTGSPITPAPTVVYNGKTLRLGTDYSVTYSNNTNIGTATVTVTGKGSYLGSVKKTFKITKKAAQINVTSTSYTKRYGEAAFTLGASVTSAADGAKLSYKSSNANVASVDNNGRVTIVGAGTATITVSADETTNYEKPADKTITINVSRADQTITGPNNLSLTYGDDNFDIGVGLDPAETGATLSYASSNSSVVNVESSGKVVINGAGSATITVTASDVSGKYNSATKKISVNVAKKELKISGITAISKSYDGTTSAELVYPSSINGIKFGDRVTVTAKGTFTDANAGTNKTVNITDIKLDSMSDRNYKIAASGNQATTTADINKAEYKGTVSAAVAVPAGKAMRGRTLDIAVFKLPSGFVDAKFEKVASLVNNDGLISEMPVVTSSGSTVSYNTEATLSGSTAKVTVLISSRNYEEVAATATLTAQAITLDWSKYFAAKSSVVYGTARSDMFSKSATAGTAADAEGKALSGKFEIVGASEKPVVSADNTVTVNFTVTASGDYNGVVLTNTYKVPVTAKEIGLTWSNDKNLVYNGTAQNVKATATGLVGSDAVNVTVTGGNAINAGTHTATATALTGSAAGNYKLPASVTRVYTIAKADYTVALSATSVSVKEGTADLSFLPTATAKGVANEQPAGAIKFYSDSARRNQLTAAYIKGIKAGQYNIYWSYTTSDANYTDTVKTGTVALTVTDGDPQNISISGLDGRTYGDAAFTASASVTTTGGAALNDHGDITWSSSNTKVAEINAATGVVTIKGAGETTITAKAAKVAGKYAAGEQSATLTVAKKTLTIDSITAVNKTYDGKKDASITVKVSGAVAGDTVTVTAEGEFADAAVGTDKAVTIKSIKLDEASTANYTLPETLPDVNATISKVESKDVKAEITDLDQKTGSIKKPTVKLTPEDASADVKIFIKKTEKDETTGETKETTVEWTDETAPTAEGSYTVYAEITSSNINGKITTPDATLKITQRSTGGGGGGGGAAAAASYKVTVDNAANGTVKASASSAEKGKDVTITATPAEGYETASVKVTDASGKTVDVTKNSDGTYKFTMPGSNVTVKVEFVKKNTEVKDTVCTDMKDIDMSKWYHEAVHYTLEKGIMSGYSKDKFGPNDTLSRAMLAQILYNNAGKPAASKTATYSDVKSSDWFAPAVSWAAEKGIVTGYSDSTFRPNDNITREQLAAMLYRYAGQPATTGSLAAFTDAASVSGYAQQAMQWATANGIITGNGSATVLDPQGNATRAQAAAMIMRYLEKK